MLLGPIEASWVATCEGTKISMSTTSYLLSNIDLECLTADCTVLEESLVCGIENVWGCINVKVDLSVLPYNRAETVSNVNHV